MSGDLATILGTLARRYPPTLAERPAVAAVALVLFPDADGQPCTLLIERRRRRGDRWSGHIALPGGMASHAAESAADIARREALEEVGLQLGDAIATLPPRWTLHPRRRRPTRVVPVVFGLDRAPDLDALAFEEREVAEAFAVRLRTVIGRWGLARQRVGKRHMPVPAIRLQGERVLWGLTLAMTRPLKLVARHVR
ncbi:MAG: NUDIX domain-containing protein [Myxococcales bacterium]|nr:NUDIX domain-containing protein [Myxococcales bacterium]